MSALPGPSDRAHPAQADRRSRQKRSDDTAQRRRDDCEPKRTHSSLPWRRTDRYLSSCLSVTQLARQREGVGRSFPSARDGEKTASGARVAMGVADTILVAPAADGEKQMLTVLGLLGVVAM